MRHGGTPHSEVGTSTDSTEPRCSLGMVKKSPKTNMSHEKNTGGPLLSIESWLFNRDPYNGLL